LQLPLRRYSAFVPCIQVIDELVDAEVCEVATAARETLLRALGEGKALVALTPPLYTVPQVEAELLKALETVLPSGCDVGLPTNVYAAQMCAHLMIYDAPAPLLTADSEPLSGTWRDLVANTPKAQWKNCCVPYFTALLVGKKAAGSTAEAVRAPALEEKHQFDNGDAECTDVTESVNRMNLKPRSGSVGEVPSAATATAAERAEKLASLFRTAALGSVKDRQLEMDDEGTDLCNIEFSLAFGGKILLHNTFLKLGKGRRYGLMGKNGAGKTTLLTNIGTGNIEGLPTSMKTVYVQHDDRTEDNGVPLVDELMAQKDLVEAGVTREEAVAALTAIRFTPEMLSSPRSCLSGGWKMKLLIIKAMLSKADVLLLDEPTNHLDAGSVEWLTNYLLAQPQLTCLIVSHDTGFMDKVLTDVIHYENKKLVYYHGNLTHFVE
jgi:ABC-type multidrug transport system ATPase subunit